MLGLLCVFRESFETVYLTPSRVSFGAFHSGTPKSIINQNQFNWLGTIFYLFFLVFEYPQNLALQYLPVGKWMR